MKYIALITLPLILFCSSIKAAENIDRLNAQAIALINDDLDAAESLIERLINDYPANHLSHFYCGRIMGRQAGEAFFKALSYAQKSLECMKKAVSLAPKNILYKKGLINFYLGAPAIAGGSDELAFEQTKAIALLDKEQGVIAELDFYKQTLSESVLQKKLYNYEPQAKSSPLVGYELGLLYQQVKLFDNAHQQFMSAFENSENSALLRLNILYQIGRNAVFSKKYIQLGIKALTEYTQSERGESLPSLSWAYYRLSQLYMLANDTQAANKYRLLASNTQDKQLIERLSR